MSISRSKQREIIMIILYQINILENNKLECNIDDVIKDNLEIASDFVKEIVYGVCTHKTEIDDIANKNLIDWNINRLDKAGSAILRMGIYELLYTETPPIVVINEAIELAKRYCDENIYKMINAVMDRVISDEQ